MTRHVLTVAVYALGGLAVGLALAPLPGKYSWPLFTVFMVICGYFSRSIWVVLLGSALTSSAFWLAHYWAIRLGWWQAGADENPMMLRLAAVMFFFPWVAAAGVSFAGGQWVRRLGRDEGQCPTCGFIIAPGTCANGLCSECGATLPASLPHRAGEPNAHSG